METKPTYEELEKKVDELEKQLGGLLRDTQSRHQEIENQLARRNAFIETVLENLPIGISVTQYSTGKRSLINKKFEEICGWPKEDLMDLGDFFRNLFPDPQVRRTIRQRVLNAVNTGDPSRMAWTNLPATTKTGKPKIISGISIPLFDQDLVIGAILDNSDNFNTLKQLKESEERYRALFDRSFDSIIISDLEGRVIDANDAALKITGYTRKDIPHASLWQIIDPDQRHILGESRSKIKTDGYEEQLREYKITAKSGETKYVETRGALIYKDNKPFAILGIIRDITARKAAESRLQRTVESLHQAEEIAKIGYFERNWKTGESIWSEGLYKLLGYKNKEIENTLENFLKHVSSEDADVLGNYFLKSVDVNTNIEWEIQILQSTGKQITARGIFKTIPDKENKPEITMGAIQDITAQKALEQQLRQAQKMESIGTLAGGIAHDFNNILSIIIGNTDLALEDMSQWHPAREFLLESRAAGLRGKDVVRQLLNFSRKSDEKKKPILLSHAVLESLKLLRSSIPSNIQIIQNIPDVCPPINGDETQIHQMMFNLCSNAMDAMKNQGRIEISISTVTVSESSDPTSSDPQSGHYVKLTVRDTGHGMGPETLDRIFDPYFTTKGIGRGTGMGLAVVHGIVKAHGGIIQVESQPGIGTGFEIYFPAINMGKDEKKPNHGQFSRGTEHILFVDDEKSLVMLGDKILTKLGYAVTSCQSSIEALSLFQADPNEFDVVITDMTMPELTGEQLAESIHAIRPDVPIILCSGFNDTLHEKKARAVGIQAFLPKPVEFKTLAETVRSVLDLT